MLYVFFFLLLLRTPKSTLFPYTTLFRSQLRLESDANLVSIVTIHKSKGLQYPLVFLPFLWDDTAELSRFDDIIYFDTDQQVKLHLNPKESEKDKAKEAKLRSEERRVGKECRSRWSSYH